MGDNIKDDNKSKQLLELANFVAKTAISMFLSITSGISFLTSLLSTDDTSESICLYLIFTVHMSLNSQNK